MRHINVFRGKIRVQTDKSTKSRIIVFVKASADGVMEPIAFPLDLIVLDSVCCLH